MQPRTSLSSDDDKERTQHASPQNREVKPRRGSQIKQAPPLYLRLGCEAANTIAKTLIERKRPEVSLWSSKPV
jgi:hypothetical protein